MLTNKAARILLCMVIVLSIMAMACRKSFDPFAGEGVYTVPTTDGRATQNAINATQIALQPSTTPKPTDLPRFWIMNPDRSLLEIVTEKYQERTDLVVSEFNLPDFVAVVVQQDRIFYFNCKFSLFWYSFTYYPEDTMVFGDKALVDAYFSSLDKTGKEIVVVTAEKRDSIPDYHICRTDNKGLKCWVKTPSELEWREESLSQ